MTYIKTIIKDISQYRYTPYTNTTQNKDSFINYSDVT